MCFSLWYLVVCGYTTKIVINANVVRQWLQKPFTYNTSLIRLQRYCCYMVTRSGAPYWTSSRQCLPSHHPVLLWTIVCFSRSLWHPQHVTVCLCNMFLLASNDDDDDDDTTTLWSHNEVWYRCITTFLQGQVHNKDLQNYMQLVSVKELAEAHSVLNYVWSWLNVIAFKITYV